MGWLPVLSQYPAFESLAEYARKVIESRKMVRADYDDNEEEIDHTLKKIAAMGQSKIDAEWVEALDLRHDRDKRVSAIAPSYERHCASRAARRSGPLTPCPTI